MTANTEHLNNPLTVPVSYILILSYHIVYILAGIKGNIGTGSSKNYWADVRTNWVAIISVVEPFRFEPAPASASQAVQKVLKNLNP